MTSYKHLFSRFLENAGTRLHFAAHSHHYWPDASYEAHCAAWHCAAQHVDGKWGPVFSEVMEEARTHIAKRLSLPSSSSLCFAPNTHEFVVRLHSLFSSPPKILTTDSEFHSFRRQCQRWGEAGMAEVDVVPCEPFSSLAERIEERLQSNSYDWVYISQVFFNSGFVVEDLERIVSSIPKDTIITVDGYHGFMAVPTDLGAIADRIFYIAGGYKYAMAGEGVCFMHCPDGIGMRPSNTGWFAGFSELEGKVNEVAYAEGGQRFAGATFDPSGLFRFNAVQAMLRGEGIDVSDIHGRVRALQERFLDAIDGDILGELLPGRSSPERGHFLTFRNENAQHLHSALQGVGVMTDYRDDRFRLGFALYHDPSDVDELATRITGLSL